MDDKNTIKSIVKAFDVLEVLGNKGERTLSELARDLNYPVSTTQRIVNTILDKGYMTKNTITGKYRLGLGLMRLQNSIVENYSIVEIAKPFMEAMVDETRESSNLGILDGKEVIHVYRVESPEVLKATNILSFRLPAHTSATGKLLLAFEPIENIYRLFNKELKPCTENSIRNREQLIIELENIRKMGYAVDNEEGYHGVMGIAVPILDYKGSVLASLSLVSPTLRVNSEKISEQLKSLYKHSSGISKVLGYEKKNNEY